MGQVTIVEPITVTDTMLISSSVAETDYAVWSAATTYALGDRCISTKHHRVYESLQAGNLNHSVSDTVWWVDVGPTNRWRVFDSSNTTQTMTDGGPSPTINYTIEPGQAINALGILNITEGSSISVTMTDAVYGTVYSHTQTMLGLPALPDWWSWFFGTRRSPTQYVVTNLPAYPDASIAINVSGSSASLAVGVIVMGQQRTFSVGVKHGARVSIQDYSTKQTSEFGDTVVVKRNFAKRASLDMAITSAEVDSLQSYLALIRATPCLWIAGSGAYEALTVFGFYKSFDISITYCDYSECSLEIEGLT